MIRLSRVQLREIDRLSIEEYHIPGIVLMENAARAASDVALDMLKHGTMRKALILCGSGNNGGDGLAIARHLQNAGCDVNIAFTVDPSDYKGDALINWKIVQAMKLQSDAFHLSQLRKGGESLIIDAIFGTGLSKPPRGPFGEIARAINESEIPVLSVDVPSGLDCDTGKPFGDCVRATKTITFVAEKIGFAEETAKSFLGAILIGRIGCPIALIERVKQLKP